MKFTKWVQGLNRSIWLGVALSGGLSLTACSQVATVEEKPSAPSESKLSPQLLSQEALESAQHAQQVFQVLAAELMVEKGYPADAFNVMFPLAAETREPELAKRAFELSMTTYDEQAIAQAAALWAEVAPQEPAAWRVAYFMSLRQNQLPLALEQWQTYRQYSDATLEEDLLLAAQRLSRSAPNDAIKGFFARLQQESPEVWQAYYGLGLLYSVWQQPDGAIAQLEKAVQVLQQADKASDDAQQDAVQQIYQLLSKVYLQLDNPQPGLKGLAGYLKQFPQDWLVQERMARLEVKAERYKAAEKRYQAILKSNSEATTSRLSLALLQIEMQKYSQAAKNLQLVVKQPAYESVGYYYLGVLSQQQNLSEQAYDYFEKVKVAPYAVDAKLHQSEIVFSSKGLDAALAVLDSVKMDDDESRVKVYRAKAIFYRASDRYADAIDLFDKALTIQPDNASLLFSKAALLYEEKRYLEYEQTMQKVVALLPDEVEALNALGYFYVEQNVKLDEAAVLLNKALALAPNNYYVLDSVGWLAYRQQRYADAEEYLQQAVAIEADVEVVMHLIAVKWVLNKRAEAEKLWRQYRSQFADDSRYQSLMPTFQKQLGK
ncbi:tetratricopeptide repeat protein [Thiomicrorhabdus cannonii]|uniref:tetratricopeptide repeat protein n=1 Tax=Thiomicrorhabdus cannonii TaxID=2748011 RepID=UPI0015B7B6E3|nr:tetratricopeptide repeat protein [Thiomicrorhabdus cannonii]